MFKMGTDNAKKVFTIKVGGFFKEDEGISFLEEYKRNIAAIKPSEYALIVDGTDLITSKPEMLPVLTGCLNLYKSTGFKKIFGTLPKSPTAAIQLKKVSKDCGLNIEFASTTQELLSKL